MLLKLVFSVFFPSPPLLDIYSKGIIFRLLSENSFKMETCKGSYLCNCSCISKMIMIKMTHQTLPIPQGPVKLSPPCVKSSLSTRAHSDFFFPLTSNLLSISFTGHLIHASGFFLSLFQVIYL